MTTKATVPPARPKVAFSHVHLYVDHLDDLAEYKELEAQLNRFCKEHPTLNTTTLSHHWFDENGNHQPYRSQKRDIVKQWIAGLGFRITMARYPSDTVETNTRSVLVTSKDFNGVQFVVTATADMTSTAATDVNQHFDAANLGRFYGAHANRQGVAVLAFNVECVDTIEAQYSKLHPKLFFGKHVYEDAKVLEVFAYYNKDKEEADEGTVLRFVERAAGKDACVLPGLVPIHADFDQPSFPAYCDHWVSNVYSRPGFLSTLQDTLGFTPKVDFNAGVVAAGEAQIESTVTGNDAADTKDALRNQSQVYLPINNALSDAGHVHGFLKEIGQGVQHIASRVENLVDFVQQANDWRTITGEGFTFLNIPRSYYGILTVKQLTDQNVPLELAESVLDACQSAQITEVDGAVDLNLEASQIDEQLSSMMQGTDDSEHYLKHKNSVVDVILKSRYINLHSLLKDHISESSYLGIVRNRILVDVQGEDLLYQIFTSNILQREAGEESPFLEFIQRVCSECKDKDTGCPVDIKPGCGGFGIRNFLTLFLSIELSKAMLEGADAKAKGDERRRATAQAMVTCLTDQLNESNPILTDISNAMTREGFCREIVGSSTDEVEYWAKQMEDASCAKLEGNKKLMDCSTKYKDRMASIRKRNI